MAARSRKAHQSRSALALAVAAAFAPAALANPTGPALVSGAAQISNPAANVLQVVNTPGTILNWQGFSIGAGETTRFVQLNAASAVLNRVVGADPSSILGRLESNGRVFLVNPNGIVFGGSAVVDVAGLIASTRDISNENFRNGNYVFGGSGPGNVTLQPGAQILTSGSGGQVWLIANQVNAEAGSRISAPRGQVVLAAGQSVSVGTSHLGQMTFTVTTGAGNTVNALGEIVAQRGAVGFFADTINFGGRVSARSDAGGNGSIVAAAGSDIHVGMGALLDVSADDGADAGSIHLEAARRIEVHPGGEVLAESLLGRGGTIVLDAYQIDLPAQHAFAPWDADRGEAFRNETNQNVRAFGADAARDGSVTVRETGQFNYTSTPVAGAASQADFTFTNPADYNAGCCPRSTVLDGAMAGDGAILFLTTVGGAPPTWGWRHEFTIVRDGTPVALGELIPGSGGSGADVARLWGLTRGGWVISGSQTVRILSPTGSVVATWNFGGDGLVSVAPLPSGAVWIRKIAFDGVTELASRVYSASGTELSGDARAQALGSVRAVDVSRIATASASGAIFRSRPISSFVSDDGYLQEHSYTYDALQGSRVLTSLPDAQVASDSERLRSYSSVYSVLSVGYGEPFYLMGHLVQEARVWWRNVSNSSGGGNQSASYSEPLTGFGTGGALVLRGAFASSVAETTSTTSTYRSTILSAPEDMGGEVSRLIAWINSLNLPSEDGHYLPPIDSQTHVSNNTWLRQLSFDSGLSNLTRSAVSAPVRSGLSAGIGQSAAFETRPGVATNTEVPPPSPPPPSSGGGGGSAPTVVTGTGSGASFEGIDRLGCNAAVCSPQVRMGLAIFEATRAAERAAAAFAEAGSGPAPGTGGTGVASAAENAVRAVWTEIVNRRVLPEDTKREEAAILREVEEQQRHINELARDIHRLGHDDVEKRKQAIEEAVQRYIEREQTYQQLGLMRTNPNDRRLVDAILNMDADERAAFGEAIVKLMQTDPTFGEAPPKPAADSASAKPKPAAESASAKPKPEPNPDFPEPDDPRIVDRSDHEIETRDWRVVAEEEIDAPRDSMPGMMEKK